MVRQLAQQSLYERTIGRTTGNLTPTEKAEKSLIEQFINLFRSINIETE